MPLLVRIGLFSMTLKIAWVAWLSASLWLIVWRRRGRTMPVQRSRRTATSTSAKRTPSKRRWRLRANSDAPVLQPTSMLGL
jgi:hypothetical protein